MAIKEQVLFTDKANLVKAKNYLTNDICYNGTQIVKLLDDLIKVLTCNNLKQITLIKGSGDCYTKEEKKLSDGVRDIGMASAIIEETHFELLIELSKVLIN